MSRKNIFEILAENNDLSKEAERIDNLFVLELLLIENHQKYNEERYTLREFVTYFCFDDWKSRGHCADLQDFLETVDYEGYSEDAKYGDTESFFVIAEIILNCWKMAEIYMENNDNIDYFTNFYLLYDIIIDCLSHYNYTTVYNETTEQMLVIEDNPAITAVAEIIEPKLALNVLKYNHYTLHGDIDKKKFILLALGAELEPKRKVLSEINSNLEDGIFTMLNNLNLRHNNISMGDKNYKEFVAKMDGETLENWYDELYQMILLAFLEIEQIERNSKIKTLKADINRGK